MCSKLLPSICSLRDRNQCYIVCLWQRFLFLSWPRSWHYLLTMPDELVVLSLSLSLSLSICTLLAVNEKESNNKTMTNFFFGNDNCKVIVEGAITVICTQTRTIRATKHVFSAIPSMVSLKLHFKTWPCLMLHCTQNSSLERKARRTNQTQDTTIKTFNI